MWFVLILSLLLVGIAVAWFFSCSGGYPACQITRSFSVGAGIMGLIGVAMAAFIYFEDRKGGGRSELSGESQDDG